MTACDKTDVTYEKEATTSTSINYEYPEGYIILEDEEIKENKTNYDEQINYIINELVSKDHSKTKVLAK